MAVFLMSYDDDEARFLVLAKSPKEARTSFLKDREEAGCADLDPTLLYVEKICFPKSGVREIGR